MKVIISLLTFLSAVRGSPEQIGLNYGEDPSEMVVTWADFSTEITGEVQYGLSENSLNETSTTTGAKYMMRSYESPMIYKATLRGLLEGNKIYFYRVGSTTSGYSSVYQFKSHPGVGKQFPVTFHVMGDLGQTSNSEETLHEINDNEDALLTLSGGLISMGDLSYANGYQPDWDSFGALKQISTATIPMMTTLGNHEWFDDPEFSFTAFNARFDHPRVSGVEKLYYSVNVGLVHWIMVAGYCPEMKTVNKQPCLAPGSEQLTWLQKDLASVDSQVTPWVFVVFHQPYVNSNLAHSIETEGEPMRAAIEDTLYNAGNVDLVLSGHVHAYERSCQVYKYACTKNAPYYITIGDGGNAEGLATEWVTPQPSWSLYRQASYGHGELTVFNSTHALWQWHQNKDLSPTVADEFYAIKGGASLLGSHKGITGKPIFADSERGREAAKFDLEIRTHKFDGRISFA